MQEKQTAVLRAATILFAKVLLIALAVLLVTDLILNMVGYPFPPKKVEIRTWYDLDAIRDNPSGSYLLMNDLNFTTAGYEELASPTADGGKGWQPIGWEPTGTPPGPFTGSFDGQGYEIHDLFINLPDDSRVGLFRQVTQQGVIKDVGVVNATVTGNGYVGGLVGYNGGAVSNSYCTGSVDGRECVGGLLGWNGGAVSNSYSASDVSGNDSVGGFVGYNAGHVTNSYSSGNVTGNDDVGGLVGYNGANGLIARSFWDTQTSGQATSAGIGTGRTTAEMKDMATFTARWWDIVAVANSSAHNSSYIWNIVEHETYPFLSWQS
jgi:hypothetical protein